MSLSRELEQPSRDRQSSVVGATPRTAASASTAVSTHEAVVPQVGSQLHSVSYGSHVALRNVDMDAWLVGQGFVDNSMRLAPGKEFTAQGQMHAARIAAQETVLAATGAGGLQGALKAAVGDVVRVCTDRQCLDCWSQAAWCPARATSFGVVCSKLCRLSSMVLSQLLLS